MTANTPDDDLLARVRKKLQQKYNPLGELADGTKLKLQVEALTFSRARLIVTDGCTTVERFWEYPSIMLAQLAGLLWEKENLQNEPKGWRRAHSLEHPWNAEFRRRDDFWKDEDGIRLFAEHPDLMDEFLEREGMPFEMAGESDLHVNPVLLHLAVQAYRQRQESEQ